MQIVVLGMHRSGTSAVTRLITMMGTYLCPEEKLMAVNIDNPKGYWERWDVVKLNDRMLGAAAALWNRVADFSPERIDEPDRTTLTQEAQRILHAMDAHRPWVLKDPRLCLTFPLWRPFLELPVCIHVVRDPIQVARSLQTRDRLPLSFGVDLWEKYHISALRAAQGLPQVWLAHDDLLRDPVGTVARLYTDLCNQGVTGLRLPQEREITAFIDPALYRQKSDTATTRATLSQAQTALFTALSEGRTAELALDDWPLAVTEDRLRDYEHLLNQSALSQAQFTSYRQQQSVIQRLQQELAECQQRPPTRSEEFTQLQQTLSEHSVQYQHLLQQLLALHTRYESRVLDLTEREHELATELAACRQTLTQQGSELHLLHTLLTNAHSQSQRQDNAIHTLLDYLDQIDRSIEVLFRSLTWRTGLLAANSYRTLTFNQHRPLAHNHIQSLLQAAAAWKQTYWAGLREEQRQLLEQMSNIGTGGSAPTP